MPSDIAEASKPKTRNYRRQHQPYENETSRGEVVSFPRRANPQHHFDTDPRPSLTMTDLTPNSLYSVEGLVAVITGGGTGMKDADIFALRITKNVVGFGLMLAQSLEANGAVVYILGRRQEVLEQAARTAVYFQNLRVSEPELMSHRKIAIYIPSRPT